MHNLPFLRRRREKIQRAILERGFRPTNGFDNVADCLVDVGAPVYLLHHDLLGVVFEELSHGVENALVVCLASGLLLVENAL